MKRYLRFIVHQKIGGESWPMGPFSAAYHLLDDAELARYDRERLGQLLVWFERELTVPPRGTIPSQAIFWYSEVGPFSQRMWELAQLLSEYDFTVEMVTAKFVGRVVYEDQHQVAALRTARRHR
jgi:hypothetical protein